MVEISALMRLQEEMLMIDLANKCVLVRTQKEYESVLKEARRQGYKWYRRKRSISF